MLQYQHHKGGAGVTQRRKRQKWAFFQYFFFCFLFFCFSAIDLIGSKKEFILTLFVSRVRNATKKKKRKQK